jgi:F-type H+-transporting ATPase subunit epsilon
MAAGVVSVLRADSGLVGLRRIGRPIEPVLRRGRGRFDIKVTILNPKRMIFEGEAESVFLPGDRGEFELMDHHVPIVSLLTAGQVVLDWKQTVPIKNGMVKFDRNECVILVEE